MRISSTRNLKKLKNKLTGLACKDLMQLSPSYVLQYLVQDLTDPTQYTLPQSVRNDPNFQKWRTISVDLMDVEFQKHRILICLRLLSSTKHPRVSLGEWLDHEQLYWAVLLQGLISKFEKLFIEVYRRFHRPKPTSPDLQKLLSALKQHHIMLKGLRDPAAHPGGPVTIFGDDSNLGPYLVFRGDYDIGSMLAAGGDFYSQQIPTIKIYTNLVFKEIDHLCSILLASLPELVSKALAKPHKESPLS